MVSSLHSEQEFDRIAAHFAARGALALLLVEVEPLCHIERRYGTAVYQHALEGLMELVRELARQAVPSEDLIVTQDQRDNVILAFLFRPRSDREFYGEKLRRLASRVSASLVRQGRSALYPYHREPLAVAVGLSVLLHNPTVKHERQILQALEDARRDARLEAGLRARRGGWRVLQLILSRELDVRFEPIVNLRTEETMGYEALVRGPKNSELHSPRELFRLADEVGLLFELDCLCRRIALEESRFLERGKKLFLNCLPTAMADPSLRDEGLRKMLENFNLRPSDLVLEISENESIENFATFREMRDACQEIGIDIAIDDAGTGYSSLEAIMEIAPDFIKTDAGLARGIDSDPSRREILRALNSVAEGIGALVIAEGIETPEELSVLRDLGISFGQGFHFGPALLPESNR